LTGAARPLDNFPLFRTRNAEEMCAALARVYAKPTVFLEARAKTVDVAVNHYQAKDVAIAYTKYGTAITAVYPENNFVLQSFPVRGRGEITVNRTKSPLGPRHGMIISPGRRFAIKLNANYEHFVLVINAPSLAAKLAALTGVAIKYPVSCNTTADGKTPAADALRNHFFFLVDQLSTSVAAVPRFVMAEFEQTLMVMFLLANRHNYSHLLERPSPDSAPWQVRRVEEYVETNWQQAITFENLAEISGVSAFSLLRSFRKSRGYSPMEFVSRVRLGHARELLQRPNAATTVAEIAASCGFVDVDDFAVSYVDAFGEPPSQTIKRGRDATPARGKT